MSQTKALEYFRTVVYISSQSSLWQRILNGPSGHNFAQLHKSMSCFPPGLLTEPNTNFPFRIPYLEFWMCFIYEKHLIESVLILVLEKVGKSIFPWPQNWHSVIFRSSHKHVTLGRNFLVFLVSHPSFPISFFWDQNVLPSYKTEFLTKNRWV